MSDKSTSGTEQENPLADRGGDKDGRRCELCGDFTNKTAIPITQSEASGYDGPTVVQLLACERCQIRLWSELSDMYGTDTEHGDSA